LPLAAELVALSGCETGRGRLHGADLLSLAQGFMGAGAASLLVSLWRVDDAATARLMRDFYDALRQGQTRAQALQQAQLLMLRAGRQATGRARLYTHPAYWAPFVLLGKAGGMEIEDGDRDKR
jgi:CHAT domain-containing protein